MSLATISAIDGWNSIASAPQDGTVMLLHNPDKWRYPMRGYWDTQIGGWSAEFRGLTLSNGTIDDPTCWLPVVVANKVKPLTFVNWR